jgi:cytochrome b pre-mRNA-processing protein 3
MIFKLLRQNPSIGTIQGLYGAIVAQARLPSFYQRYGVPDTVDGRFDLIVVHLFLVAERLGRDRGLGLAQPLVEEFCRDLDHNLREMGVGDLTVPRRMRSYMEAFLGRSEAYRAAFAAADPQACAQALARNVFGRDEPHDGAWLLADYMGLAARTLDTVPATALEQGKLEFPDPEKVPAVST